MKYLSKKIKQNKKYYLSAIIGLAVCALVIARFITSSWSGNNWWKFLTSGELYISPSIYKNLLYIGNSNGKMNAVDRKSGKPKWGYSAESAISSKPAFFKNAVIFTSDDGTLYALLTTTGKELWRFSTPDFYRFSTSPQLYKGLLLISDTMGSLYALNPDTGRVKWKFDSVKDVGGQTSFSTNNSLIFYAGAGGLVYAIEYGTGRVKWKFDTGASITTYPEILGDRLYIANKNGDSYALSQQNGSIAWHQKNVVSVSCLLPINPLNELLFLTGNSAIQKIFAVLTQVIPWRPAIIQTTADGFIRLISNDGKNVYWKYDTKQANPQCPNKWFSSLYVVHDNKLDSLDMRTGSLKWSFLSTGLFHHSPYIEWRPFFVNIPQKIIALNVPMLLIGNSQGELLAVNGRSGTKLWQSHCYGGIFSAPISDGDNVYYSCTDGGLYNVSIVTGRGINPSRQIQITQNVQTIRNMNIVEFTISHNDDLYTNPFEEVAVSAIFKHENKGTVTINGFYYDKNTWKLRFNPPEKGSWQWTLTFTTPFHQFTKSGTLTSTTDTHTSFFKVSKQNSRWITLDNQTIFNGIGMDNSIRDTNNNGNPLDDWSIGEDAPSTLSGIINLDTYATTYGPDNGGFNIFRWIISDNSGSFNLWDTFTTQSKYSVTKGKYGDTLVQNLTDKGFHIWLTLFGFGIPYSKTQLPNEQAALRRYVQYVIARYGAYVSMWEIANEAIVDDSIVNFIAKEIKTLDFEKRPVGMSLEHPELSSLDFISPHRYLTEDLHQSDLWMIKQISLFQKYNKPILFGEMGNHLTNWDAESAKRMRVKSWVAFFNQAILIFWNYSSGKNFHNYVIGLANQYIGPEERKYMLNLHRFTNDVPVDAKPVPLSSMNESVRSYGLESSKEFLGYFFHYSDPYKKTTVTVPISLAYDSSIVWYDPETGATISQKQYTSGRTILTSPAFSTDIALKATRIH